MGAACAGGGGPLALGYNYFAAEAIAATGFLRFPYYLSNFFFY